MKNGKKLILLLMGAVIIAGGYYFFVFNKQSVQKIQEKQKIIEEQNKKLEDLQDRVTLLEKTPTSTVAEIEINKNTEQQKEITSSNQTKPSGSENLDLILTNYKIDTQDGRELRNDMLTTSYNSSDQFCPSIIANRTTKQNIYYAVLNNIESLENKYGKYRNKIEFIKNNLDGLWGIISIIKDRCEAIGYNI